MDKREIVGNVVENVVCHLFHCAGFMCWECGLSLIEIVGNVVHHSSHCGGSM